MSISIDLHDLESLVGRKLGIDELREVIKYAKMEIDNVDGEKVELEVTHDRPDHFSVEGIARTFKGILGIEVGLAELKSVWRTDLSHIDDVPNRKYVVFAIMRGFSLSDEAIRQMIQLQEKLSTIYGRNRRRASIGVYDLSKVDLPVVYKQANIDDVSYIPLEMNREIRGTELFSLEKGRMYGEYAMLNGKVPIIADSNGRVLAVAPVLGSESTKVDPNTRDILIDVTATDIKSLREVFTIFVYGLRERTLNHVVELIGTNALSEKDLNPTERQIELSDINKRLGVSLNMDEALNLLLRARHDASKIDEDLIQVKIAPYRLGVIHAVDIIEDAAIIKGYHEIPGINPSSPSSGRLHPITRLVGLIREAMIGLGAQEVMNYVLTDPYLASLGGTPIKLVNPISELYSMVRTAIWPQLVSLLARNKTLAPRKPKVFEIGRVASIDDGSVIEENHLGFAITGNEVTLTDVLVMSSSLINQLGLKASYEAINEENGINGRSVKIIVNGFTIGKAFEVNPDILMKLGLENPTGIFEVSIDELLKLIFQ
ncbi:MAG: phenylalanine--tRNA ligase subunit beta [Thermocladium sp.]